MTVPITEKDDGVDEIFDHFWNYAAGPLGGHPKIGLPTAKHQLYKLISGGMPETSKLSDDMSIGYNLAIEAVHEILAQLFGEVE